MHLANSDAGCTIENLWGRRQSGDWGRVLEKKKQQEREIPGNIAGLDARLQQRRSEQKQT